MASACGVRRVPPALQDDPVVATVDQVTIRASQVASQMRGQGTSDARKALADRIVFELLARAAEDATLGTPADEQTEVRLVTVQRLIERELEPLLTRQAIPDAEVRALYEKGKRRFVHGRLVQALVLGFFTGARMKPEPRARAEQNATLLEAFLDQHPPATPAALERLAKDPVWVERKLSASTVWQEENQGEPYPELVGRALAKLAPGSLSPLLVDETGAYIVLVLAKKPAEARTFEQVAPELRNEMHEPWRRQRFLHLIMDMASGHDVTVVPENLALLSTPSSSDR
jgi:hypothetical protein